MTGERANQIWAEQGRTADLQQVWELCYQPRGLTMGLSCPVQSRKTIKTKLCTSGQPEPVRHIYHQGNTEFNVSRAVRGLKQRLQAFDQMRMRLRLSGRGGVCPVSGQSAAF